MMILIAQATRAVGWSLVLIALIVVAFLAVMQLRKWLQSNDEGPPSIGFTLGDLRQLHKEGKMTDEEFERARAKMMAGAKAMAEKLPDPLAGSRKRREDNK